MPAIRQLPVDLRLSLLSIGSPSEIITQKPLAQPGPVRFDVVPKCLGHKCVKAAAPSMIDEVRRLQPPFSRFSDLKPGAATAPTSCHR